jgi:hypothetical protein
MGADQPGPIAGFGQSDPTDNRQRLDWASKYSDPARKEIRREAVYLGVLLFGAPAAMLTLWLRWPQHWTGLLDPQYAVVLKFGLAWGIFTPHISGGLAFGVIALIESDVIRIFDRTITDRSVTVVGIAFLIGYFSDSAIAKLTEVAETLFGTTRSREKHRETDTNDSSTAPRP